MLTRQACTAEGLSLAKDLVQQVQGRALSAVSEYVCSYDVHPLADVVLRF
jgi:hypothetical protein